MIRRYLTKNCAVIIAVMMGVVSFAGCGKNTSETQTSNIVGNGNSAVSSGYTNYSEVCVETVDYYCEESYVNYGSADKCTEIDPDYVIDDSFDTREYSYVDENRFYTAKLTPYSTFAADVDTASYSNIRSYIRDYQVVPSSAVRIEEMVNYFNYDYAEPAEGEPFSVNMEIGDCPWEGEHKLISIGLKAEDIPLDNQKNNFVFLIDTSGSMDSPNKLPLVKTAFTQLIYELDENDTVSIVTYAGSERVLLQGVSGDNAAAIVDALDELMAYGSTNGSAGIEKAYELAEKYFIEDGNNRVILATDGDLNVGVTDEGSLVKLVKKKKESGVFLSVLGFGTDNLKDNKLEKMADYGDGNYAFIDSVFEAKKVLVNEMGATLNTVAKDVKLQAEFNDEIVEEYRLIGYENRTMAAEDFADDTVDGGEIGAGHRVTAIYEVKLTDKGEEMLNSDAENDLDEDDLDEDGKNSGRLLTLGIRYKAPDGDTSTLVTYELTGESYSSEGSDNLKFQAAVCGFGMILKDSQYKGSLTDDMVLSLAKSTDYEDDTVKEEFVSLVERHKDIY